jgi:uncharacterized OB-fold protein
MSIRCLECGEPLQSEDVACPKCGSKNRSVEVKDQVRIFEMCKVKEKSKGYHKFKKSLKKGEQIGKNGKPARITLIMNKETRRKYHLVEQQNEKGDWVIVDKDDDEPF